MIMVVVLVIVDSVISNKNVKIVHMLYIMLTHHIISLCKYVNMYTQ